jgi:hypothetical protein
VVVVAPSGTRVCSGMSGKAMALQGMCGDVEEGTLRLPLPGPIIDV